MAKLKDHQAAQCTKLLVCAVSGGGKTGALAALAAEGYKLRIFDFDNGLDILFNYLTDPASPYYKKNPKAVENVEFIRFWSKSKNSSGKLIPSPKAWQYAMDAMDNWQDYTEVEERDAKGAVVMLNGQPKMLRTPVPGSSLGPVKSWGEDVVFVVDSLSGMSDAAFEFTLMLNARLGQGIRESDWGDAQQLMWEYLEKIVNEVNCNVILNCHIVDVSKENEPQMLMPKSIGKKLPKDIPTKFNTILELKKGKDGKPAFHTRAANMQGALPVKTSAPLKVAETYGIEWGLVEYFRAVQGGKKC